MFRTVKRNLPRRVVATELLRKRRVPALGARRALVAVLAVSMIAVLCPSVVRASSSGAAASMGSARSGQAAVRLGSGKVLVIGGHSGSAFLSSTELYHPGTNQWSVGPEMSVPRYEPAATLLGDGRVLVAGGSRADSVTVTGSAEIYDPVTNAWTATGSLNEARESYASVLMPDGRVLIVGGAFGNGVCCRGAEVWDPATGGWTVVPGATPRQTPSVVLLNTGKVLVAGGGVATVQLFDPTTNTWSATGAMAAARNAQGAALLPDGRVLVVGGSLASGAVVGTTQIYNPATGVWTTADAMSDIRTGIQRATIVVANKIVVAGGYGGGTAYRNTAQVYNPATNLWTIGPSLSTGRAFAPAVLMDRGQVLVPGGSNGTSILASADVLSIGFGLGSNSPPSVAITGVAHGATYEFSGVPEPTCTVNDAEDGTLSFAATVSGNTTGLGSRTASCTYTDSAGAAGTASATYAVVDTTAPQISTPSGITTEATSSAGAAVAYPTPVATDAFDDSPPVTCAPSSGSTFALGTTSVSCTTQDSSGNAGGAIFTVLVVDTTGPEPPALGQITAAATSASGALVTYIAPDSFDLVDGLRPTTCLPPSGSSFPLGSTTVMCSASDTRGNVRTVSFPVVVQDVSAPLLTVPASIVEEATSPAGAMVSYGEVTASDAVDGSIVAACAPLSNSVFDLGSTTVTCAASDSHGNEGTGSFTVTVEDTTAPTLLVPASVHVEATSPNGAAASWSATASDLVDDDVTVSCDTDPGVFPLGGTLVVCSATDDAGNSTSSSFSVTVVDTTAPTVPALSDVAAEATSSLGAAVNYIVAPALDVVSGVVGLNCVPSTGTVFPVGRTTVTCTATDASGNRASADFGVHVIDTTPPVLTMPPNQTAAATSAAGAVVDYPSPSASDVVDGMIDVSCSQAGNTRFPIGDTTVQCTAVDAHGNETNASFVVRVQDEAAPQIHVPGAISVEATSAAGAVVDYGTVGATDDVDGTLEATCAPPAGGIFPLGATTVGCSATDVAGNDGSQTFSITVVDTSAPSLSISASVPGAANITVAATSSLGTAVALPEAVAIDIVDGAITPTCSATSGSVFPLGTTTVTCAAIDAAGNETHKSYTVTVTYSWSGIRQPINADNTSVFKLGSTTPVKFQLAGPSAAIGTATGRLYYSKMSNGVTGTEMEALSTSSPDSGNLFRYDTSSGQYVFNLSTKLLGAGSWLLRVELGDGVPRTVIVGYRK